jgi:hypothetical protein
MAHIKFGRWSLLGDPDSTRRAYVDVVQGAAESCGCCHCRNFIAARGDIYPVEALHLFDCLGIDPSKETKVYHLTRLDSGLHLYGGFFHFSGRIVAGRDAIQQDGSIKLEPVSEMFALGCTAQVSLVSPVFAELPVTQIEFLAHVPWRLSNHPEPA